MAPGSDGVLLTPDNCKSGEVSEAGSDRLGRRHPTEIAGYVSFVDVGSRSVSLAGRRYRPPPS